MPCPTTLFGALPSSHETPAQQPPDAATQAAIAEQESLGLDILDAGGVRRDHSVYDHLGRLRGVEVPPEATLKRAAKEAREAREAGEPEKTATPRARVRGPITPGRRYLRHDWRAAQDATRRPVQIALPGPLTMARFIEDGHYGDTRALCAALGDALNHEIRDLAAAGCPWIRIDEPAFADVPDAAAAFGVDNVARCFHKVPREVTRFVHLPRPLPAELDGPDPDDGDGEAHAQLAEVLADAPLDAVSLPDARRRNDLRLLEIFTATTVVLGVIDVAVSDLETVDAIRDRLRAALAHIDPHRLMAAPDARLDLLPPTLARDKLSVMVAAAKAA